VNGDLSVAEQRELFRTWLRAKLGDTRIRMVETHVSILGIGGDRVWKLKKAVRFPFVDLSTRELRRLNAEREITLNRRFAPDVYLGVVPLDDGEGAVGDVVVEMRRMPDERRLTVVASHAPSDARRCIDQIADALVRIHRRAPSGAEIDRAGSAEAVLELWVRNIDEMREFGESILDTSVLGRVMSDARAYVAGRGSLFAQRIAERRIRDGHGDLLADDVFCLDDGPRFLDCLEFDDQLRYGDVLGDIAFLAMDLERLEHRDLGARLLDRYRRTSGDSWPASLADLYIAYRAVVRSKIACLRNAPGDRATARSLLALASEHLTAGRVRLVLIGGSPATGKTTLARELGRRTGWKVLHSDEVRKGLAGIAPTTSAANTLDAGLYTPEWSSRTYDALLEGAGALLARGESVILDASWSDARRRDDASRLAESTSSAQAAFVLSTSGRVADDRARVRASRHSDASDASAEISGALRARFAPWADAVSLDATRPVGALASAVLEGVDFRV